MSRSRLDTTPELPPLKSRALDELMKYLNTLKKKEDKNRTKKLKVYLEDKPISRQTSNNRNLNKLPITNLENYRNELFERKNFDDIRRANNVFERFNLPLISEGNNANKNGGKKRTNKKRTNNKRTNKKRTNKKRTNNKRTNKKTKCNRFTSSI